MSRGWQWFGVKTLYRMSPRGRPKGTDALYAENLSLIEERVVLVRARSFDEAIKKAEKEAREYARERYRNPYGQEVVTRYLGYCDAYDMSPEDPGSGVEVYSRTAVMSGRLSDRRVLEHSLGYRETAALSRRRRNFLDIVFEAPAPGVRLTARELAFVERWDLWLRRPRPDA